MKRLLLAALLLVGCGAQEPELTGDREIFYIPHKNDLDGIYYGQKLLGLCEFGVKAQYRFNNVQYYKVCSECMPKCEMLTEEETKEFVKGLEKE